MWDWLYGLGALFFGGSSLFLYVQQVFLASLISFVVATFLVYLIEAKE